MGLFMSNTVLIIEDEEDLAALISLNLQRAGYNTAIAYDGIQGIDKAFSTSPHLIILDVMMPHKDGYSVLKDLKKDSRTRNLPVMMVTAQDQTQQRIEGFESGADDYMVKPFSPKELVLRVKALMKRSTQESGATIFSLGPMQFDKNQMAFFLNGERINLTATEFKMLLYMAERKGKTLSRKEIYEVIWGYGDTVNSRTLDTHMMRLRLKLGDYSDIIQTFRGKGYVVTL